VSKEWISYDSVAGGHDSRVPLFFEAPARDLAARMDLAAAGSLLDVGTGTGIVALQAGCAMVVGTDPSVEMLRRARANGVPFVAAAEAAELPFADETFDRVTAGFVLSHVPSYADALADMVRVLRRGGRLGVTCWSLLDNEYRDAWHALMNEFVDVRALDAEALPWEEWLMKPANVAAALASAGLSGVAVEEREYSIRTTIEAFLAMRETSLATRYLRRRDPEGWERFRDRVTGEFHRRFRDPVVFTQRALIATGLR
jgi:SAM-dependent methyltransferase